MPLLAAANIIELDLASVVYKERSIICPCSYCSLRQLTLAGCDPSTGLAILRVDLAYGIR